MKIKYFLFLIFALPHVFLFSQNNDIRLKSNISRTKIKIGEKIRISVVIEDPLYSHAEVMWDDIAVSHKEADIYVKKDYINNKMLNCEITFSIFKASEYNDFYFIIPINLDNNAVYKLKTSSFDILVENILTEEEIDNIKKIKDPSKIRLKKEKPQADMPFVFSRMIKILLFIAFFILLLFISYFVFYKVIKKVIDKKGSSKLNPYEDFIVKMQKLVFLKDESRKATEIKLSRLTEIFKELILFDFSLNAPSETTNELIVSLKSINFDGSFISCVKKILDETDLIKFAKADYDNERIVELKDRIKEMGGKIHQYKISLSSIKDSGSNENI